MKLLTVIILLGLTACGGNGGVPTTVGGNNTGNGCTIEAVANLGVNITCDGETVFVPNGAKGEKGDTGDTGIQGETGSNVFADALAIHTSKRKSVFRLTVYCEIDLNNDGIFGDNLGTTADPLYYFASHRGTGFLLPNNEVATNKHVAGNDSCDVDLDSGTHFEGQIYAISVESVGNSADNLSSGSSTWAILTSFTSSSTYDLTKFSVSSSFTTGKEAFEIDNTNNESMLTPTLSMSFPLGITDMITNIGEIVTDDVSVFSGYDFMTSNDTDGGSSGSPIIDITTGKVIGVLTAGFATANMNPAIIIHASRLNDF